MDHPKTARGAACTIVAAWVLSTFIGCNNSGQVPVYPVKGRVTFEGKSMVGGGAISFVPAAGQVGKAAGGLIGQDGSYSLTTYADGDGSMAGDFRVIIMQEVFKEPTATPDGAAPAAAATDVAPADRIPAVYSNQQASPLTAKVETRPNEIDFDLKRQ